jgi:hypothetical protein
MPKEGMTVGLLVTVSTYVEIMGKSKGWQICGKVPNCAVLQLVLLMLSSMGQRENESIWVFEVAVAFTRPGYRGKATEGLSVLTQYKGKGGILLAVAP